LQRHVFHTEFTDQLIVSELLDRVNIYSNTDAYILPPFVLSVRPAVRFPAPSHWHAAALPTRTSLGIRTRVRICALLAIKTALLQF
jgi:hypothetical protein